jgi:hypothetical protein
MSNCGPPNRVNQRVYLRILADERRGAGSENAVNHFVAILALSAHAKLIK